LSKKEPDASFLFELGGEGFKNIVAKFDLD